MTYKPAVIFAALLWLINFPVLAQVSVTPSEQVLATGLNFPEGPSLSPDGKFLYCVNVHDANITRIDLKTGQVMKDWVVLPAPGRGNGSTIGPDGALYVTDVGRKLIARISLPDGALSTVVDKNGAGQPFLGPNDLCFDKAGNLYFTDPGDWSTTDPHGAAYELEWATKKVMLIGTGLMYPNGIVVDSKTSSIYVDQTPLGVVTKFAPPTYSGSMGMGESIIQPSLFAEVSSGPDGMRRDKYGNLYVALSGGGGVARVSPDGKIVKTYLITAGHSVTNLCFTKDGKGLYVTVSDANEVVKIKL